MYSGLLSSFPVFRSWQGLHNACQLLSSHIRCGLPRCGMIWSTTVAVVNRPCAKHFTHSGCFRRYALLSRCCRSHAWRQTDGLGAGACVRRSTHPRSVSDSRDACRVSLLSSALPASPFGITKAAAATHNGFVHILLLYIIAHTTRAFK